VKQNSKYLGQTGNDFGMAWFRRQVQNPFPTVEQIAEREAKIRKEIEIAFKFVKKPGK
jgi:hypothetical protein